MQRPSKAFPAKDTRDAAVRIVAIAGVSSHFRPIGRLFAEAFAPSPRPPYFRPPHHPFRALSAPRPAHHFVPVAVRVNSMRPRIPSYLILGLLVGPADLRYMIFQTAVLLPPGASRGAYRAQGSWRPRSSSFLGPYEGAWHYLRLFVLRSDRTSP